MKQRKEQELEALREEERLKKEAEAVVKEPKKPRKRKAFAIPEKERLDDDGEPKATTYVVPEMERQPAKPVYISGGLRFQILK